MATTKRKGPRPKTKSGKPRARKGVKIKPTELGATELAIDGGAPRTTRARSPSAWRATAARVLAAYREPLGGHALLFAALPDRARRADAVSSATSPTAHVRKLTLRDGQDASASSIR